MRRQEQNVGRNADAFTQRAVGTLHFSRGCNCETKRQERIIIHRNKTYHLNTFILVLLCLAANLRLYAQKNEKAPSPVYLGTDSLLAYSPDAQGNRVPDFSYCGYRAAEQVIPNVPIRIVVPVKKGDATNRIQSAIDHVSSLPADAQGFRGAVLLQKGTYEIAGALTIRASGVVLRGTGMGEGGTVLLGTGTDRQTLITISGKFDRKLNSVARITDPYVPVNAMTIHVAPGHSFKPGDMVVVHRPSTSGWIKKIGAEHFGGGITSLGWKPGQRDLLWDRKITAVNGHALTLDAPVTTAMDSAYGGGTISTYTWPGRINGIGVENLRCRSVYNKANEKDEDHRWMAVTMENVMDAWVRQVVFEHFAGSAVAIFETAKRVTVEDCKSLAPVSEIGGERRYTFFTSGQQTLFQRNYSEFGYHDFAAGFCAPGPNAFVQCESHLPYNFSGAIDSWASGTLFDIVNVDGHALSFMNRGQDANGAGWSAANSVFWQCTAAKINCYQPPGASNWAFGCWSQFSGDGYWEESNNHIKPRSLYYAQLNDRLGNIAPTRSQLLPLETNATSSPQVRQAMELTAEAAKPAPVLTEWIDQAAIRQPIPTSHHGIKAIDELAIQKPPAIQPAPSMQVRNGWLLRGNNVLTGRRNEVPWWNGSSRPYALANARPHITRYVPGRTGRGQTDDLDELTDTMADQNRVALEHNYGLWYERRRDDHERIRRMDGEVWPPFYELPFARSGKGLAWDGLSKYDLTRYNAWYWNRLKAFADFADQKGLVLVHHNYFQHNIIEAGAHYADFPWRPANNINATGFPEPVPYAGDKRIFMAEQFYDVSHPVRRKLHQAYIRKCLDNFAQNNGVIQLISAEYTGPLHFVQFWIDTIRDWEKQTGKKALVGLSTTKDVQDAILADPLRAAAVDLIDIRYWFYRQDGSVFAPAGGQNLAPRQHARLVNPGRTSFEQVYRAVQEYRNKFPGKAVMYSADGYEQNGWPVFMGGGSLAALPQIKTRSFLQEAAAMQPVATSVNGQWKLEKKGTGCIIYAGSDKPVHLDLSNEEGSYTIRWIDPASGGFVGKEEKVQGGSKTDILKPGTGAIVMWVSRQNKLATGESNQSTGAQTLTK